MNQTGFEKAMGVIRGHADKIYVFESDRKAIVFAYAKEENENVNALMSEVHDFFDDRLDIVFVNKYDLIQVGEKAIDNNEDEINLDLG